MLENLVEENVEKAQILFTQKKEDLEAKRQEQAQAESQRIIQQEQAKAQAEAQKEQMMAQMKAQQMEMEKDLELRNEKEKEEERRKTEAIILDGKKELLRLQAELEAQYAKEKDPNDSPNRTSPAAPKTNVTI
jgi:hypothetical protein